MSKKKNTGLLIAFGAVLGAAAAGISYYLKYKSFNDEIDKDFHDYEEEETKEEANDEPVSFNETNRTYITLDANKIKSSHDAESCNESTQTECPTAEDTSAAIKEDKEDSDTEASAAAITEDSNSDATAAAITADSNSDATAAAITEDLNSDATAAATVEEDTEGAI